MVYLSVCQVNLQKCREATQLFQNKLQTDNFLGCVQEPYTVANKLVFRPQGYQVIPEATLSEVPRAALYIPRHIHAVQLGNLCSPDCAVVQVKWQGENIIVVSGYMDITDVVELPWLIAILNYADSHDMRLLLALDTNAHSSFYSMAQSNARGRRLEDLILQHLLRVENRGFMPTFQTVRAQSIIDVTLTKGIDVWNWHVDTTYNASDHHTIFYDIEVEEVPPKDIRPWAKADWRKFTDTLDKNRPLPDRMTCKKLDREVDKLYKDIDYALHLACPKFTASNKRKKSDWYTDKIAILHRKVKKQYKRALEVDSEYEWEKHNILKKKFRRRCRRAKTIVWRKFVNDTPDEHKMAQLSRIALHRDRRNLNVLNNVDGSVTEPGQDTIRRLAEVHFPQATHFDRFPSHVSSRAEDTAVIMQKYSYVSDTLVRRSLRKFKPQKAPGPDQLKPIIFRYLPLTIINFVTFLYKCCLHLRYTPRKWQESLVVFIPKAGKKDPRECKAYRPIVLSNFFLKGLERLITWRMDEHLVQYPIHPLQHGFQIGKGTEAALSNTCDYIEQFLLKRKYCLGVFLDITSAYDSMSIEHIRSSLYKHGGDDDLVEWYFGYLSHRVLKIDLHGDSLTFMCSQGFPQGGVASAKFWIICFNTAIEIINRQFTFGNGYADDLSVLFGGSHPDDLTVRMQRVIDELVEWGETCNLRFNPEKTVMVGFTRGLRYQFQQPVYMRGQPLKFADTVKYLGLLLDKRMTWRPHILEKVALCKQFLIKMTNIAHTTWGPRPKLMRWVYRCVVRPKITYGALVWAFSVKTKGLRLKLRRLNRLGISTYARVHRSSPSRGLEIITDTFPLHLYLQKEAVCAYVRLRNVLTLRWTGLDRRNPRVRSHLLLLQHAVRDHGIFHFIQDMDVCNLPRPECIFTISSFTARHRDAYKGFGNVTCRIYTDGSKQNGRVGASFIVYIQAERIFSRGFRLPDHSTVFQAELYAIREAARYVCSRNIAWPLCFFVDSQAALLALQKEQILSRLVSETIAALNGIQTPVHLVWVPAHTGVFGNEEADVLAKEATFLNTVVELAISKVAIKTMVLDSLRNVWNELWNAYPAARMTKYFFPRNDALKARHAMTLSRLQLGRFIRIITGHNKLRYFHSKMDSTVSPLCRFCHGEVETFHHFVFECPSLFFSRRDIFLDTPPDMDMNWSVDKLLAFSYLPHINSLLDPHSVHTITLVQTDSETDSGEDADDPEPMLTSD